MKQKILVPIKTKHVAVLKIRLRTFQCSHSNQSTGCPKLMHYRLIAYMFLRLFVCLFSICFEWACQDF